MKIILNIFFIIAALAPNAVAQPFATPRAALKVSPLTANLDAANFLILNIGNAGTDFTTGGGLTLATGMIVTDTATGIGTLTVPSGGAAFSSSATTNNAYIRMGNNAGSLNIQDNNGNLPVGVFISVGGGIHVNSTGFVAFSNSTTNQNTLDTSIARSAAGVACVGVGGSTCTGKLQVGSSGAPMISVLSGTASLNFGATVGGTCDTLTLTVTGAADGDVVDIGVPNALASSDANANFTSYVSAGNTVSVVRCCDRLAGSCSDPAAATVRAMVTQF